MIMQTPKIDLYPHNQETYDRIIEMWQTSNRVAVIQATGTGKTYLMLRCMVDFEPSNKVVLAPSNYILDQLLSKANGNLPNTELLTYAKLAFMTKEEIALLNPSLIVLDEFHRCGADKWELGVDMLIKMFPNAKILGTSATPIRYLDNARDMSDELFEGNIAVNLSLSDAIVKGILPMPKYISALYTFDEEINNLQAKIEKSKNDEETKKEYLKEVEALKNKLNKSKGIPEILKKHITDVGGKFIVFCKDKAHLNEMESTVVDWFNKAKIGKTVEKYRVVTGELENNKVMSEFRKNKKFQNIRLLFSIDMLNEGVHVDDITGVILLRPTVSPIIFYQQIGRAIQVGDVNSPIIFDFVNNFNNMRVGDFIKELKESRENEIKTKTASGEDEIFISDFTIIDESQEARDLFLILEDSILSDWNIMFEKYKDQKLEGNKMRNWIKQQRQSYNSNKLTHDRIEKLNNIGFLWDAFTEAWNVHFNELIKYTNENGDCLVPGDLKINNVFLGEWVRRQRREFRRNLLTVDRIAKLNNINFIWEPYDNDWNLHYNELINYYEMNGNVNVPRNLFFNKVNLGAWVSVQRTRKRNNILKEERIKLLNDVGFRWDLHNKLNKEDKPNE